MNYNTATDQQLEDKLAELVGFEPCETTKLVAGFVKEMRERNDPLINRCVHGMKDSPSPRYCTDWSVTMPLAVEHGVYYTPRCGTYFAVQSLGDFKFKGFTQSESPLRAIVICLIKVLESEK